MYFYIALLCNNRQDFYFGASAELLVRVRDTERAEVTNKQLAVWNEGVSPISFTCVKLASHTHTQQSRRELHVDTFVKYVSQLNCSEYRYYFTLTLLHL